MGSSNDLYNTLRRIDGAGYKAYHDTLGGWKFPEGWSLHLDKIQSDPFAPPSRCVCMYAGMSAPQSSVSMSLWLLVCTVVLVWRVCVCVCVCVCVHAYACSFVTVFLYL